MDHETDIRAPIAKDDTKQMRRKNRALRQGAPSAGGSAFDAAMKWNGKKNALN